MILVVAAAGVLAGCAGEAGPAGPALQETAQNLGSIRSGDLTFNVEVDPKDDGEPFGFAVEGPFALAEDGALPKLDVEYTQTANGESETVRLVLDGERAVAEAGGRTVELSEQQLEQLRGAGTALGGEGGGLDELRIDGWLVDPKRSDGPDNTDKIEGDLDVVALTNGLLEVVGAFRGSERAKIDGADADRLRDAVESADFEILTGKDDRILRQLEFDISLGVDVPDELRDALGNDVVGADISFLLALDRPNEPIDVSLP
ncbi:MAG: hypothetical protein H0V45_00460 [Actinobacteria bacterium]|nr:hypothetical protein [Actinomycetota bacterium]